MKPKQIVDLPNKCTELMNDVNFDKVWVHPCICQGKMVGALN